MHSAQHAVVIREVKVEVSPRAAFEIQRHRCVYALQAGRQRALASFEAAAVLSFNLCRSPYHNPSGRMVALVVLCFHPPSGS